MKKHTKNPPFFVHDDFLGIHPFYFRLLIAVLFILLAQTYWIGQNVYVEEGFVPIAQPDTAIYYQYARAWAGGHPFRFFTAADAPTTGCTSLLYPFLLSALYHLPLQGSQVILGGFWLHIVLLAGTIILAGQCAKRIHRSIQYPSMLLITLSGQTWYTFLGQTDMGLLVFMSVSTIYSVLYNKRLLSLLLFILLPFAHPIGLMFSVVLCILGLIFIRRFPSFFIYGLAGMTAYATIMGINIHLTGHAKFMSLNGKGYFTLLSPLHALLKTIGDTFLIIRGFFFGLTSDLRQFHTIPVISGLLVLIGIIRRPWHRSRRNIAEIWVLLTCMGAILLVGSSGWQMLSCDRYLAFIIPFWIIYMVYGLYCIARWTGKRNNATARVGLLILCGFYGLFSTSYISRFITDIGNLKSSVHFMHEQLDVLPPETTIGGRSYNAYAMYNEPREMYHIFGILSAEFAWQPELIYCLENFKYRPQNRMDLWIYDGHCTNSAPWMNFFMGETIATDRSAPHSANTPSFKKADWSLLPCGTGPDTVIQTNGTTFHQLSRLDMGYLTDETKMDYESDTYWIGAKPLSFMSVLTNQQNTAYADVGHAIIGSCSFTPTVTTQRNLLIVMRTAAHADFPTNIGSEQQYDFVNPLPLEVRVDDSAPLMLELPLQTNGMTDVTFTIPGTLLQSEHPRINLMGDFVAYALWFYQ
ncbi:MAG: hypothetical protein EOL87_09505 [Spartobacteria bacterium]|nr:hypothetical protein [Spartobacteria bacterium]